MTEQNQSFEAGARVVRQGTAGPKGTVQKVRTDTVRSSIVNSKDMDRGTTVTVIWDNGTVSHYISGSLELA